MSPFSSPTRVTRIFSGVFVGVSIAACSSTEPTPTPAPSSSSTSRTEPKPHDSTPTDPKQPSSQPTDPGTPSEPTPSDPTPKGKDLGEICGKDGDCASNLCLFKGSSPRGVCTKQCNLVVDCPGGFTKWDDCAEVENVTGKVCIPKT